VAEDPFLVIDGTGLLVKCNRAGSPRGMHANGSRTGPLLLFINSLARLIRVHQPSHVLVALDGLQARSWRQSLVPSYKKDRPEPPSQESGEYRLAASFCLGAGIATLCHEGYEADDVIAYAYRRLLQDRAGLPMVIASDDADLHQLAGPGTIQVSLSEHGRTVTDAWVRHTYGCEPYRLPRLKAVAGDKSDGVEGIKGVGLVKALALLQRTRWVLLNIEHKAFQDSVTLERELCLNEDIFELRNGIHAIWMEPGMEEYQMWQETRWPSPVPTREALRKFLDRYELASVSARLEAGRLW
jgi:DNA polymerase-1